MEVDTNSTVQIDSLLKSYPSLQRLSDKDRVRGMFCAEIDQNSFLFA